MIHGVVARRGIQAIRLTHENRYEITDLVKGKLRQQLHLEPGISFYRYELVFERDGHHWSMKDGEWMLLSPQGFVAIMDDESFHVWFETVSLSDAAERSVTR